MTTQAAHPGASVGDSTWTIEEHRVGRGGLTDARMLCASGGEEPSAALWEKTSGAECQERFQNQMVAVPSFKGTPRSGGGKRMKIALTRTPPAQELGFQHPKGRGSRKSNKGKLTKTESRGQKEELSCTLSPGVSHRKNCHTPQQKDPPQEGIMSTDPTEGWTLHLL